MSFDERWPWGGLGLLAGSAIGLADAILMASLDADMTIGGRDLTAVFFATFAVTYGLLGYLVGRLVNAHLRARADARTIQQQLERVERAQREVVQQEKLAAIGRLAAGVAHEVRNPLGVIRSSASMVQESFEPGEDPHRACEFICEEIDRLDGLINGLLSFARPTELGLQPTSLEKVIDCALQLASDELRERGIEVERTGEAAPELRADPDLLAQVVYGLVLNAAQALGKGGRIAVRVRLEADAVLLEVADDGPGVDPDVAPHIFEPFVTTKATGTGLGLPMAVRIAEAHGGSLTWLPAHGVGEGGTGACFQVRIPQPEVMDRQASIRQPAAMDRR